MNASGCGVTVKEYGHSLAHDPAYATKAGRIADLTRDVAELLPDLVRSCAAVWLSPARRRASVAGSAQRTLPAERRACTTGTAWLPSAVHAAARPARARRGRDRARARSASTSASRPTRRTCAAARRGRTRCCSPSSPTRCATASSANLGAAGAGDHRLGQHRLHPASAERHDDAGAALDRGARRRARALTAARDDAALRGARPRPGARGARSLHLALRRRTRTAPSRRSRPTAAAS